MTAQSGPSQLSPALLRQALRLIHCLQKERGASCAYSVSSQYLPNMEAARQQSDVALKLFPKAQVTVASTLVKIRARLDESEEIDELLSRFHRILVRFNTLISSVVHTYISEHATTPSHKITSVTTVARMKKSCSVESFIPYHQKISIEHPKSWQPSSSSNVLGECDIPPPPESIPAAHVQLKSSSPPPESARKATSSPRFAARKVERRRHISFDAKAMETFMQPNPAVSLMNLLSCFVRLKESTGKERALLSAMLTIGAVHPRILTDLVLEVENQRSLVQELREQTRVESSLLHLIREGVVLPPQLEELQQQILLKFNLSGIQLPSTQTVWNLITIYMDRLHSLELLLIEELESALANADPTDIVPPTLDELPTILQSILRDVYWQDWPAEEVKAKLVKYMGGAKGSCVPSSATPDPLHRADSIEANSNHSKEKSEWDINLYEIQFQKRIGRGTAGTTYLATWSGQEVAVKVAAITEMGLDGWKTETSSLQRLHHPNIIRLLGSIYNPSPLTYCLVLEYCNAGDLSTALTAVTPPNFFDRVSKDMAHGLAFLHSRDVIHRDIKPANVLLHGNIRTGDFVAKVTDFGVATNQQSHASNRTAETGTYRWMAPEVIRHESYSETADVYSFAIVLWQLITRENPFYDKSPIEAAGKVALELARPAFPEGVPAAVAGLIERCWDEDPNYRWSFDEVSKLLAALQLSDDEREWMQTPSGHQIYEVVDEVPQRLPPGPRRIQSERLLDKVHPKPEKKGLRKFFSKK